MPSRTLSAEAEDDYRNIFDFGVERFGVEQALTYLLGMDALLDTLPETPLIHPQVGEEAFRRAVYKSHVIYFKVTKEDHVLIVRIIGRQAFPRSYNP